MYLLVKLYSSVLKGVTRPPPVPSPCSHWFHTLPALCSRVPCQSTPRRLPISRTSTVLYSDALPARNISPPVASARLRCEGSGGAGERGGGRPEITTTQARGAEAH